MNKVFRHNQAIENRMLIKKVQLDHYGDELIGVNFAFHQNADESMLIIRVSERERYASFPGTFSVN